MKGPSPSRGAGSRITWANTIQLRALRGGQPMETDQYIGVDLHKASFQVCAITPRGERLWEARFARTAEGIAAFVARCTPRERGRGGSHDADVALCRSDHGARGDGVCGRYPQDEAQSGLCGEDRSAGCATARRCVAPRKRGQYLRAAAGDPRAARIGAASADADPDAHTGAATDAGPAVAARTRRSADEALTECGGPGVARCDVVLPAAGAPRPHDAATDRTRSVRAARTGRGRHRA